MSIEVADNLFCDSLKCGCSVGVGQARISRLSRRCSTDVGHGHNEVHIAYAPGDDIGRLRGLSGTPALNRFIPQGFESCVSL
jgi:hypothetical protein